MIAIGDTFDRFVVEAEIGRGGMGRVFRALDTRLQRHVALKILSCDEGASPAARTEAATRLLREARAAASLDHPNAICIFDVGQVGEAPYIAMELLSGTTLRSHVGNRLVEWPERLRWLLDTARALGAAHAKGLVHRDVKPENVMILTDGRVKVLDFGVARRASVDLDIPARATGAIPTLTASGRLVGTPLYMAPEYVQGQMLDGRADQFAWGVMAYELFSGDPPWMGGDTLALLAAMLTQAPRPMGERCPELPIEVCQAIQRTLAQKPDARFETMEALVAELEPWSASYITGNELRASGVPNAVRVTPGRGEPGRTGPSRTSSAEAHSSTLRALPNPVTGVSTRPEMLVEPRRSLPHWPRRKGLIAAGGLALALALGTLGLYARRQAEVDSRGPVATVASPGLSSAGASAYAAGIQALHDASVEAARRRFEEAIGIDPSLASAHLRLVPLVFLHQPSLGREHFQKARQFRSSLDPVDQGLLDGLEPIVAREPADWDDAARRLIGATERFPRNAELFHYLGLVRFFQGRFEESARASDRALALDPSFTMAAWQKAQTELYGGTREAAAQAVDRCIALAPSATLCLKRRIVLAEIEGRCGDAERDARRLVAADPQSAIGYKWLAQSLFATGKPRDAVAELVRQEVARVPESQRRVTELDSLSCLDLASGAFTSAEKRLRELDTAMAPSAELLAHVGPALSLMELYSEMGDDARAAAVADDFLRRKDAWISDPGTDDFAVELDVTPSMLFALRRAGRITPAAFEKDLSRWIDGWEAKLPRAYRGYLWIYGIAGTVETRKQAEDAIAALPRFAPLPWYRPGLMADALVGRAYFLAGRLDEAAPILEQAGKNCRAFDDPLRWVKARAWLAELREAKGDNDGACRAWSDVLERWGSSSGRSKTAGEARRRRAALGCR